MDTLDLAEGASRSTHVHVLESAYAVCFCGDYWGWVLHGSVGPSFLATDILGLNTENEFGI